MLVASTQRHKVSVSRLFLQSRHRGQVSNIDCQNSNNSKVSILSRPTAQHTKHLVPLVRKPHATLPYVCKMAPFPLTTSQQQLVIKRMNLSPPDLALKEFYAFINRYPYVKVTTHLYKEAFKRHAELGQFDAIFLLFDRLKRLKKPPPKTYEQISQLCGANHPKVLALLAERDKKKQLLTTE